MPFFKAFWTNKLVKLTVDNVSEPAYNKHIDSDSAQSITQRKFIMNTYTIDYLDTNGLATFISIDAFSKGMAEDLFHETYGEELEIVEIHMEKEAAE